VTKVFLRQAIGWGAGLWGFGYVLGIILFMVVPTAVVGWVIMPLGIAATLWVLLKKIQSGSLKYYLALAVMWTVIAVVFDYLFLVKVFKPADGYYKPDVYSYYLLTFILPAGVGIIKNK
jgi:hypothetical protein